MSANSLKCYFRFPNGHYCDKWAKRGSRFCHHHQPAAHPHTDPYDAPSMARLATKGDLFQFIRESLVAVRMGSITPSQGFAIACLSDRWMKLHYKLDYTAEKRALEDQMLAQLVDANSAAAAEREAALAEEDAALEPPPDPDPPQPDPPAASPLPEGQVEGAAVDAVAAATASASSSALVPDLPANPIAAAFAAHAPVSPNHQIVQSPNHPISKSPDHPIPQSPDDQTTRSPDRPIPQSPGLSIPTLDIEAAADRLITHFQRQILNSIAPDRRSSANGRHRNRSG